MPRPDDKAREIADEILNLFPKKKKNKRKTSPQPDQYPIVNDGFRPR